MDQRVRCVIGLLVCVACSGEAVHTDGRLAEDEVERHLGADFARQMALLRDAPDEPAGAHEYVRVIGHHLPGSREDRGIVQTAIRVFDLSDHNARVTLVATHHISRPMYWQTLSRKFEDFDIVLSEGVEDTQNKIESAGGMGSRSQESPATEFVKTIRRYDRLLTSVGGLVDEIVWELDAWDERWVRADLSWQEFEARLAQPDASPDLSELAAYLDRMERLQREGDLAGLRDQILAGYVQAAVQKLSYTSTREDPAWEQLSRAREEVLLRELRRCLERSAKEGGAPIRIGVKFGANHMPRIEEAIRRDYKARLISSTWLDSFAARVKRAEPAEEASGIEQPG